mgnify:CR=1 FL=1
MTPDVLVQVGHADEQRRRRREQGFFHRLAEGFARQVKGDAAQEGRFARAGIADDHQPRVFQRFLEAAGARGPPSVRSASPAVVSSMYRSWMGKRCALPVPTCKPRMSIQAVSSRSH